MKTKKADLLELQNLYLELKRARGTRKEKIEKAIEKIKNRVPEYLAQRVEDFLGRGNLALTPALNETCSGCHLMLPRGIANQLAVSEGLFVCENCGRFVYAQPMANEFSASSDTHVSSSIR